jgi:hypothetical protein
MRLRKMLLLTLLIVLSGSLSTNTYAQVGDNKSLTDLPRQFAANAFGQAGSTAGKSFGLTLYITGWTTDEQVKDFVVVLKEKGPEGLVAAMNKTNDVGRVAPVGFVGNGFRVYTV